MSSRGLGRFHHKEPYQPSYAQFAFNTTLLRAEPIFQPQNVKKTVMKTAVPRPCPHKHHVDENQGDKAELFFIRIEYLESLCSVWL